MSTGTESGEGIIDRFARRTGELFSWLFFASMLIIAWEVVLRYGFNAPTIWAHDVTTAICAVAFLVSGLYTLNRRQHIAITILHERLPVRARRVLDVINYLIVLVFLALLTYQGWGDAVKSVGMMETAGTASRLPIPAIVKSALVFAAAFMFVQVLAQLRRLIARGPRP